MTVGFAIPAITLSVASAFSGSNSIYSAFNDTVLIDFPLDFADNNFTIPNGINSTVSLKHNISAINEVDNNDTTDAELKENTKLLKELSELEDDWDQCGAPAIRKDIVESLFMLLPNLDHQPDLFPTPDGTIQLEYAIKPNKHLNIEILSGDSMTIFEMFADRSAVKETYDLDYKLINSRVKKFNENI